MNSIHRHNRRSPIPVFIVIGATVSAFFTIWCMENSVSLLVAEKPVTAAATVPPSDDCDAEAETPPANASTAPSSGASESDGLFPGEDVEYLLLLGVDRSEHGVGRTDAILIAAFNHTRKAIGIISIPRDIWVDIPDLYEARINAVVRIGEIKKGEGKGLPLLRQVIHKYFGISVNHTLTADFEGFINIVDFLEGIPVEVRCPIEDCFHVRDADAGNGCEPLSLDAGIHQLDGATALMLARSRHGRSDIDRGRRQQAILSGLKARLTRPAIIPKLPRLWKKLSRYTQTDLDVATAFRIGRLVISAGKRDIHGLVLKEPCYEETVTPDGKQVLLLDGATTREALSKLFEAPSPGQRRKNAPCPNADVGLHWRDRHKSPATVSP